MAQAQEAPQDLREQLALDDSHLALNGIARTMELAQKEVSGAEQSLHFAQNYQPPAPTPDPGHDRGSLDHQDWLVENHRESDEEVRADLYYREDKLDKAHEVLSTLFEDKDAIKAGEKGAITKYAQQERERIEAEIKKQEAATAYALAHEKHLEGVEIDGAPQLDAAIKELATLSTAHKQSMSGWRFIGTPRHGKRMMFERTPVDTDGLTYAQTHQETELLSIGFNEDGTEVQFSKATDIDQAAVARYDKNLATVEAYKFTIKTDGNVIDNGHKNGTVHKHLPNHMDNGDITATVVKRGSNYERVEKEPLQADDIAKMQAKIQEVTEAMKEVAAN
ncbi:MAG: hypothetical protein JWO41_28 [Candidatus Saccharibacteria bacterium]|nr:hypothetical protein [Candidatus Saccharibacteria bacterium]